MTNPLAVGSVLDKIVLNPVQREAVLYSSGPQLVFAGAGTGKTRVLTAKIAFLIKQQGLAPHKIFAATFTNKAAREMQERLNTVFGIPTTGLWIGTFHSMCARLLRRDGAAMGYVPSFTIYDDDDHMALIKKIATELGIDERTMPPRTIAQAISRFKNICKAPRDIVADPQRFFENELVSVYERYQQELKKNQAMDFDDLLTNAVFLLRDYPAVAQKYRTMFSYVLVDEYQDTNAAQLQLVKLLDGGRGSVFAVGDDDQSIYGWRGADIENILSFGNAFAGTKVFTLEQNYRSTKPILAFANAAIKPNLKRAPKNLWTERTSGDQVRVVQYRDDRQESDEIAQSITAQIRTGCNAGDIAILYRTNAQSRSFEETLRRHKVPYILVGGVSFYERKEIKDCLAYLRLLINPCDDIAFERIVNVPARGLGDKARDALRDVARRQGTAMLPCLLGGHAAGGAAGRAQKGLQELKALFELLGESVKQALPPQEIVTQFLEASGYLNALEEEGSEESENRIDNINELINALTQWHDDNPDKELYAFLEEVTLAADVDTLKQAGEAVTLMTLHCAKGLEFKSVYLVGLEDGIIPSRQNCDDDAKIEEERRLFYVGATRAMRSLHCSYAQQRLRFGSVVSMPPSRFFISIGEELYHFTDKAETYERPRETPVSGRSFGAPPQRSAPSRTMAQFSPGTARVAYGTVASAPVTPPSSRRETHFDDDFSQDTVQFRMGQHVTHKLYGQGKVISISGFGDDMRLVVLFADGARRKMVAKFANFET